MNSQSILKNNLKIYKAAQYTRLSKEDGDKEESSSITNQIKIIERYVEENKNIVIVKKYVDDGWSGANFDRPAFKEMLEDIKKGIIDTVITKDLSRLGRDYIDTGHYLQRFFPENNIRYIAILDNIDTLVDNGMDDIAPFKSIINDMYIKDISKKVKGALDEKRKAGNFIGTTTPYGYMKDPQNKNHLVIDPEESKIVKRIFKLYLDGNGLTKIAKILTKEKIPVPGKMRNIKPKNKTVLYDSWKQTTISRILRNKVYIGHLVQFKRRNLNYKSKVRIYNPESEQLICKNTHEGIINESDFNLVQEIINKNGSFKRTKHDYLFKGLLFCEECGSRLNITYSNYALKKYGEYRYTTICYAYSKYYNDVCTRHSNHLSILEKLLLEHIKSVCQKYISEKLDKELLRIIEKKKHEQTEKKDNEQKIKELEQKIEDTKLYIKNLYIDKIKKVISEEEYIELSDEFSKERIIYEQEIEKIHEMEKNNKKSEEDANKLEKIAKDFVSLKKPSKQLLNALIEKITISEQHEVKIYYKFSALNQIELCENNKIEKAAVKKGNKKAS